MCTVTWVHEADGYQLLCNRDEQLTRARASVPRVETRNGVRFIAPIDGNFGGSWIGTNEFGLSVCLLNGVNKTEATPRVSRGLLLLDLLTAESVSEVCERVSAADLSFYAAFTLAALEPGTETAVMEWDGIEKAIFPFGESYLPLTSSSFDTEGVRAKRRDAFARRVKANGKLDANLLFSFHEDHGPRANAYSACMHRPDAETVSFSWIKVTSSEAEFFYTPAAPCKWSPGDHKKLALRQ